MKYADVQAAFDAWVEACRAKKRDAVRLGKAFWTLRREWVKTHP